MRAVSGELPWLRRADSNTFMAGSGRLFTKIYPFAVNYKTSSGSFAPINNQLLASGGEYVQAANDLGVVLPSSAGGAAHVADGAGSLGFALAGASGPGRVTGAVEEFPTALPGVDLTYRSLNSGIGWQTSMTAAAASRGLSWVVSPSSGLSAKLVSGGVAFVNAAGAVAWRFAAPTATSASGRPQRVRVSLSSTVQGTVVRVTSSGAGAAPTAARTAATATPTSVGAAGTATPAAATSGSQVVWNGLVVPGTFTYAGSQHQTGDCYVDSGSPDTSFCLGNTNYVGPSDHTLVNFDIVDSIPSHAEVLNAYLDMELSSQTSGTAEAVGVWQAAQPWTNLATWNTYDGATGWNTPGGDTTGSMLDQATIGASSDVGHFTYWDIDHAMQGWVDGNPGQVDGLIVEATAGSGAPNTLGFATETDPNNYPFIGVYYEQRMGAYPGARYDSQRLNDRSTLGVNVGTGNVLVSNSDVNLAGVDGLNVNIGRYYNNLSTDQNSLGTGWSMGAGADTYLAVPADADNTVDYFDGTGSALPFYTDASGQVVPPPGLDASLSMNGGSSWASSQFTISFRHSGISETFTAPANQTNKIAQLSSLSDRNGNAIHYYYNASGQLDHLVDSHGQTTSFTYSSAGYVSQITDPSGRTYKYTQNASGQLTSYTDPAGNWDHYAYDSYGNLTQITTPQGNVTTIAYDAGNTNRVTSVTRYVHPTDTTGPQTTYQFATASGTCLANAGWTQGTVNDPDQHVTTYCTDDMSRITGITDPNGHSRTTGYTQDGYIASLTSALQTPTTFQYSSTDGNDNVTQIQQGTGSSAVTVGLQYTDAAPNQYLPTALTDPQGNQINYGYDANGNLTSETDQLASQNQATMTYNPDGTVATSKDADGNQTTYGYTNGNLTSVTPPSGSGLNPISLFYDTANRVTEISSVNVAKTSGHEVDYTYDPLDRVTQAVYKNAAGSTVATISYSYDKDGNLLSRTDSAGTTSYTYDGLNRELSESVPRGSGYDSTDYTYDPAGNITALSDAGGSVTYRYDMANQMTAVYDPNQSKPAATLTYDADGNLLRTAYQSGASVVRTYDGNDRLTSITDTYKTSSGQTAHLSYTYGYSGDLRSSVTDQAGNQTTYTYDKLNRLTEANTTGPNASDYKYTLDGAGNITSIDANGTTTSFTYNPGNEIATGGGHTYSYDADGNLLSNGNGLTATYNALGQTTSITAGGTTTNFSYLGEGQNQLSAENTNTLHNDLLGVAWRETCSCTYYFTRTITGQQIDERGPTATYNYLYDGNGSVVALTDSTGHLVNQYAYDPYGNKTTSTGTAPNYFAFQDGYQTIPGLYHYGARYLNPTDARWTQQDPLQNIKSLTENDRYEFAGGDPINNTDLTGMSFWGDVFKTGNIILHAGESVATIGLGVAIGTGCEALSGGSATPWCVVAGGEVASAGLIGAYATYREATR